MGEPARRQLTALGLGLGGIAVVVVGFLPFNHHVDAAVPGLLLLVPVVLASAMGGWKVAVPVAVVAALSYSIAFLPPLGRPHVSSARDIASLVTFVSVGLLVALIAGRRAERDAAGLDDQRAMLLRTVSHDLRSPLHTIMSATDQLAADGTVDAERSELLDVVAGESRRLDRIVANMLSVGRLDAGVLVPDRSPEYLPALVAATVRRIEASGAGSVTVAIDPDVGDVSVDAVQFDQVLTNLVDNAIRHSPPEAFAAPVVVAATRRGDEVEVSVSDEGPGFPPEVVAAGPQPYRSGDRSAGVGLGLVVCQGIVTAHGGRLTLTNRPSGGAVATFTLPGKAD